MVSVGALSLKARMMITDSNIHKLNGEISNDRGESSSCNIQLEEGDFRLSGDGGSE
jgi:cell division protein FtsL